MSAPWNPTQSDLNGWFAPLRAFPRIILAVSGGSDSTALLHLVVRWLHSLEPSAPDVSVATVDHGLRPQSRSEAEQTIAAARSLGLMANILTWSGAKPGTGLQEAAREARYTLLAAHASASGPLPCAIVTAHTRDDLAETVLMRLARGSGPDGLQGIREVRTIGTSANIFLVRPLLDVSRAQLREYLRQEGVAWIDDPSNEDRRFERVRVRAVAPVLAEIGLTPEKLALAARRQQRAVAALECATDQLAHQALDLNGGAFASIDAASLRCAPSDIQVRLLGRVLTMFGGESVPAELAQIEALADRLASDPASRVTLGGCEVRSCARVIRVFRERGRADLAGFELEPGSERTWDARFRIRLRADAKPMTVRSLDRTALEALRNTGSRRLFVPTRAAATLPAVWADDVLVAVGGITFQTEGDDAERLRSMIEMSFLFGHTVADAF